MNREDQQLKDMDAEHCKGCAFFETNKNWPESHKKWFVIGVYPICIADGNLTGDVDQCPMGKRDG